MTAATKLASNSFIRKFFPATHCSPRITSCFSRNIMIPINEGGGGYPTSRPKYSFRAREIPLAALALALIFSTVFGSAQAQRGTLVHEETIRVSPAADAAKLGE